MWLHASHTDYLSGRVRAPASKSQSIRGLFFGLLSGGSCMLENCLACEDIDDACRVLSAFGMRIQYGAGALELQSPRLPFSCPVDSVYTGNSGLTTYFVLPLLGLRDTSDVILVECGEQMRMRPIAPLVKALRHLGLCIEYQGQDGLFPLTVSGRLIGRKTMVCGLSSQYVSSLLIALPLAEESSEIVVHGLCERPYVEMTLRWLREFGIILSHRQEKDTDYFWIQGGQSYRPFCRQIAGDFSSASYLIAASVLLPGEVLVSGLDFQESQGDKRLIVLLQEMGADIVWHEDGVLIRGGNLLRGIAIDANDIPDLLPTLAVVATQADGITTLSRVRQARIKETDRISSMTQGLRAMGACIVEGTDGMQIARSPLSGARVRGFGDHRTVMALALAGLISAGETWIDDAAAIGKTFPQFVDAMRSIGAQLEWVNAPPVGKLPGSTLIIGNRP